MSSIGEYLAKNLNIKLNSEVSIRKSTMGWEIIDFDGKVAGHYDWVISTVPVEQSLKVITGLFFSL